MGGRRLGVAHVERWLDTSAEACAMHCSNAADFTCRSFNYHAAKRLCTLAEDDAGRAGGLRPVLPSSFQSSTGLGINSET